MTAIYIGASAEVVETAVTTPLEQQINGVEGMRYMTSTSGNDGLSQIVRSPSMSTATPIWPRSTCRTASARPPGACPTR